MTEYLVRLFEHNNWANRQIIAACTMLSVLGLTPPDIDGWSYGEVAGALIPIPQ